MKTKIRHAIIYSLIAFFAILFFAVIMPKTSSMFGAISNNRPQASPSNQFGSINVSGAIIASTTKAAITDTGGQVFNVKAFGAKGDGGTDDTAAIQTAINAAEVFGGNVFFPPSSSSYETTGVTISGAHTISIWGYGALLGISGSNRTGITVSVGDVWPAYPVDIYGLGITGHSGAGNVGVDVIDSQNVHLTSMVIRTCMAYGIRFHNVSTGGYNELHTLKDVMVRDGGTGIAFIKEAAANVSFNEDAFNNVNISNNTTGLYVGSSSDMRRTSFKNVTIWVGANQTGAYLDGWLNDTTWEYMFEFSSTTNAYAVELGPNVVYTNQQAYPQYKLNMAFTKCSTCGAMTYIKNSSSMPPLIYDTGSEFKGIPSSVADNSLLQGNQYNLWLDESSHKIAYKAKESDGSTVQSGYFLTSSSSASQWNTSNLGVYSNMIVSTSTVTGDSYSETNFDGSYYSLTTTTPLTKIGQSFTAGSTGSLLKAKFYLKKSGSATSTAVATLYAHAGTFGVSSVPTGPALATSDTFDVSTLTSSPQLITFNFTGANKYLMAAGTNYVIVLEYNDGNASNYVMIGKDQTTITHSGNSVNFVSSWAYSNTKDIPFYVYETVTYGTNVGIGNNNPSYLLTLGSSTNTAIVPNAGIFSIASSAPQGLEVNMQNQSSANTAFGEFCIGGDNSTSLTYQTCFGHNNSAYNQSAYSVQGVNSGYMIQTDGDLTVGTASSTNGNFIIYTGGTQVANTRLSIDKNGYIFISMPNTNVGSTTPNKVTVLNEPWGIPVTTSANMGATYSDDFTRMLEWDTSAAGSIYLRNSGFAKATNLWYGTNGQTITYTSLQNAVVVGRGAITYQGYHYVLTASTTDPIYTTIKRATSSDSNDISLVANWATSTISGYTLPTSSFIIGAGGGRLYVATSTTGFVWLTISTSTNTLILASSTVISGVGQLAYNNTRINENGVYLAWNAVPYVRKYTLNGVAVTGILNSFAGAPSTTGPDMFATPYSIYGLNANSTNYMAKVISY